MPPQTSKIVIGIPTFRRPQGLRRLLISIAEQRAPFLPVIVVADNEGERGAGLKVVRELQSRGNYPFPIHGVPVPDRGISQVRNAIMRVGFEELKADALAMVDDDEWVEPGWIAALVAMQKEVNADVVGGLVLPEFEREPPKWVRHLNLYSWPCHRSGQVELISGSASILFGSRLAAEFRDERFDPAFSRSGGGDKELFVRLKRKGAIFAFAPEAISHEHFGASRITMRWAIERAYRIGIGDARILTTHLRSRKGWIVELGKIVAAFAVAPVQIVLAWSMPQRMRGIITLARQFGKLSGFLGYRLNVYDQTHGS